MWIKKTEAFPKTSGKYKVKLSVGSYNPQVYIVISYFSLTDIRPRFSGEGDWNYVIEWWDENQADEIHNSTGI